MSKSSLVNVNVPAYEGNYTKGRSGRKIEAITIHHMAGRLTAEQCGKIFQQVGRYGSSHYGIGYDGRIGQYVDETDTAWTNSNWDSNCKSVTIETSDNDNSWYVNDITLNSLIKLVADIAKRNNLGTLVPGKNLTWHSMFTSTTCPGDYLRSKMQYIADEANKINCGSSVPSSNVVNVYYRVKTQKHGWLPEVKNLEDYAGWENSPITGLAIKVDKGSIKYRVHIKGGNWLPYVTGCNINDFNNGFAGDGKSIIDAVEVYYFTPNDIRPYKKAKYKVNNYPYQYDNEKGNGMDGYAGVYGVNATKFQIVIE
ncbi:MAG: peptidoglycan recognition family protein [Candidatus Onthovivens sp.]|nr:peptidoglycan recognition family protein [Candidatus Onthovivens sp.]